MKSLIKFSLFSSLLVLSLCVAPTRTARASDFSIQFGTAYPNSVAYFGYGPRYSDYHYRPRYHYYHHPRYHHHHCEPYVPRAVYYRSYSPYYAPSYGRGYVGFGW